MVVMQVLLVCMATNGYLPGVGTIWVKKEALRQGVSEVSGHPGAGKCLVVRSPVVMQGLLACIALLCG